jgi:hypothetical protein
MVWSARTILRATFSLISSTHYVGISLQLLHSAKEGQLDPSHECRINSPCTLVSSSAGVHVLMLMMLLGSAVGLPSDAVDTNQRKAPLSPEVVSWELMDDDFDDEDSRDNEEDTVVRTFLGFTSGVRRHEHVFLAVT